MEMGKGDWAIQLEKEYGKLEDQVKEEFPQDVSEILGMAIFAVLQYSANPK